MKSVTNIGFVGWRGMVGSVLLDRMRAEHEFDGIEPTFFSTSNAGGESPPEANGKPLTDALDLDALAAHDALLVCQGGGYTTKIYTALREKGWDGYWIDAASTLRMQDDSVVVLDPVNRHIIDEALKQGTRTLVGGNCTVSLMILALDGLLRAGLVAWVHSSTYQAASGAGAAHMKELITQMGYLHEAAEQPLANPASSALEVDRAVTEALHSSAFPKEAFPTALAANLIPWIDRQVERGQSREEWKGFVELNKILSCDPPVGVDGICVRIGTLRCHSQSFLIKLREDIPLSEIERILQSGNQWVRFIENTPEATVSGLTPAAVTGTLDIPVGRLHKMNFGSEYLAAFSVGDQLLWGAAEPLRRALAIVRGNL